MHHPFLVDGTGTFHHHHRKPYREDLPESG